MLKYNSNRWLACLTASLFFFYLSMFMNIYSPLASNLIPELHITGRQYGILSASYLLANVIFLIPAGLLCERYSVRKILLSATFTAMLLTFLFSMIHNLILGIIINFLIGLTATVCFVGPMKLIKQWFSAKNISLLIGVMLFLAMLGGMLSNLIFTWVTHHYNWRISVRLLGGIAIIILVLEYFFVFENFSKKTTKFKFNIQSYLAEIRVNKKNSFHVLLAGCYNSFLNLSLTLLGAEWGILFLSKLYHLTVMESATITSLLFLGMAFGSLIFGSLSDRLLKKGTLMMVASFASLFLFIILRFDGNLSFLSLSILFFVIGLMCGAQSLGYAITTELSTLNTTAVNTSITSVIVMLGGAVLQPIYGYLLDDTSELTLHGNHIFTATGFINSMNIFFFGYIASIFIAAYFLYALKKTTNIMKS